MLQNKPWFEVAIRKTSLPQDLLRNKRKKGWKARLYTYSCLTSTSIHLNYWASCSRESVLYAKEINR